ncbi:uncharacterized protein LOC124356513 [Homalodisca vitripennis]|uniref:uncharacterized protein LOC124356513 n=1 Tax=Homalodisca vitripennis TaxID=197043 RepID=UPI001EECC7D3|nr:uncharacterized protein LOC124356513 [Homalodisca vitripennis]
MVPNLDPREHLQHISKKANASLGFVIRASRDGLSVPSLRHLFISLVRPHLVYASVVWAPFQKNHCDLLERIQIRFLKTVGVRLGFNYREVPVTTLRDALGLPLLESRRRYLDLMFLHRLLNGSIDCPDLLGMVDLRVPVGGTRSRDLFGKTHQLTSYGYHSIIPRLLRHGNSVSARADFFGSSPTTFRENILHS